MDCRPAAYSRRSVRRPDGCVLSLPKVAYDFVNVGKSETQTVVLAPAFCVEELRELVLVVRVHAVSITDGASIVVRLVPCAPTDWQPDADFLAEEAIATATVDSRTAAKALLRDVTLPPLPSYVEVQLLATQSGSPVTFTSELSIDLFGIA